MPRGSSPKRQRQYEHIEKSERARGVSPGRAKEIAARTVNKERAQHGEAKNPSPATLRDMPAPRRGGERSHAGAQGRTYAQLYQDAKKAGLAGRSSMNKAQLERALKR